MIQVKGVGLEAREQWNEYVQRNRFAIAWQVYEWSEVVSRHYDFQFVPIAAFEGSEMVGILPLYLGEVGNRRSLISVPFAVAGGILADSEAIQQALLENAISLSKRLGDLPITLKQYKLRIPGDLKTDENYFNCELSLQGGLSTLHARINPENLAFAERAERDGLEVEYPSSDVKTFYDMLLRHHSEQGIPCTSEAWIRTLIDFGLYTFALARMNGRAVAGTMVKKFKKTVSFPFSCIHPRATDGTLNAAYGLYWDLIQHFAKENFEIFHSGRIPKTQEVMDFRLGWGGTPYPYYYQYYPNTAERTEFATKRGLKRKIASTLWKGMPLAVARRFGPALVRKFP